MKTNSNCCDARTAAVAVGRWGLGVMFFFYGLHKFMGPGGAAGFASGMIQQFEKTWLPPWLLVPFAHALPFFEVTLGALLILGLARDAVLFATGLLLLALTFGQVVLSQPQVVFNNMGFLFMTLAVLFASKYDRWALWPSCCRWSAEGSDESSKIQIT